MPRKVFTAGEVLAAADVNSFLMEQAVQTFAGTAARGSAVPSPTEGMMSYLNDTNDIQVYNGSAYTSTLGAVLVASATLSGTSFFINNCFTSEFDNYKIIYRINIAGTSRLLTRLAVGGVALDSGIYRVNYEEGASSRTIFGGVASTDFTSMDSGLTNGATYSAEINLFSPNLATSTFAITSGFAKNVVVPTSERPYAYMAYGAYDANTQADGFNFSASNTMSGSVRIYGMRNQ
jgi:hypothetical protein